MSVEVREYERKQLAEYLPKMKEVYEETDITEEAERMEDLIDVFSEEQDDDPKEYDLDDADWYELVRALGQDPFLGRDDVAKSRASWLQTKLARRTEQEAVQMGFVTDVPLMVLATGNVPSKPS